MRRLSKLAAEPIEIYDACTSGINDSALAGRFTNARNDVISTFQEYGLLAVSHRLASLTPSARGYVDQHVLAGITKIEFTNLYTAQMVSEGKPARKYYDRVMMLAPLQKCPYCGFGQASTLDHFLSKSRYPAFSVLSTNLVPACADCNNAKRASVVTNDNQTLHPYFEHDIIETEPWLYAEVVESAPPSARYFVQPPNSWPVDLRQRVFNHFNDLNLARRFAIEASSEIVALTQVMVYLASRELRDAHLSTIARVERANRPNSWRAALLSALAQSEWFLRTGYSHSVF